MRIQIEPHSDLRATPGSLYRGERRIDIIERREDENDGNELLRLP
jgi:hypothetical protein